jgi:hypothetical protein
MKITLPTKTRIQSLLFCPIFFTPAKAKTWAKQHGFRNTSVDAEGNYIRLRQDSPEMFQPGSFRTIELTKGVKAVIGRPWVAFSGNPHPKADNDATELFGTIHRDWKLHATKHKEYAALGQKKALGTYDSHAAHTRFIRLAKAAAKVYRRANKIPRKLKSVFTSTDFDRTAKMLVNEFNSYWKKGMLDQFIPKRAWHRRQEK